MLDLSNALNLNAFRHLPLKCSLVVEQPTPPKPAYALASIHPFLRLGR